MATEEAYMPYPGYVPKLVPTEPEVMPKKVAGLTPVTAAVVTFNDMGYVDVCYLLQALGKQVTGEVMVMAVQHAVAISEPDRAFLYTLEEGATEGVCGAASLLKEKYGGHGVLVSVYAWDMNTSLPINTDKREDNEDEEAASVPAVKRSLGKGVVKPSVMPSLAARDYAARKAANVSKDNIGTVNGPAALPPVYECDPLAALIMTDNEQRPPSFIHLRAKLEEAGIHITHVNVALLMFYAGGVLAPTSAWVYGINVEGEALQAVADNLFALEFKTQYGNSVVVYDVASGQRVATADGWPRAGAAAAASRMPVAVTEAAGSRRGPTLYIPLAHLRLLTGQGAGAAAQPGPDEVKVRALSVGTMYAVQRDVLRRAKAGMRVDNSAEEAGAGAASSSAVAPASSPPTPASSPLQWSLTPPPPAMRSTPPAHVRRIKPMRARSDAYDEVDGTAASEPASKRGDGLDLRLLAEALMNPAWGGLPAGSDPSWLLSLGSVQRSHVKGNAVVAVRIGPTNRMLLYDALLTPLWPAHRAAQLARGMHPTASDVRVYDMDEYDRGASASVVGAGAGAGAGSSSASSAAVADPPASFITGRIDPDTAVSFVVPADGESARPYLVRAVFMEGFCLTHTVRVEHNVMTGYFKLYAGPGACRLPKQREAGVQYRLLRALPEDMQVARQTPPRGGAGAGAAGRTPASASPGPVPRRVRRSLAAQSRGGAALYGAMRPLDLSMPLMDAEDPTAGAGAGAGAGLMPSVPGARPARLPLSPSNYRPITCSGCLEHQYNQLAHMGAGGCLEQLVAEQEDDGPADAPWYESVSDADFARALAGDMDDEPVSGSVEGGAGAGSGAGAGMPMQEDDEAGGDVPPTQPVGGAAESSTDPA